jgi:predicted nucleic acid-binding protein
LNRRKQFIDAFSLLLFLQKQGPFQIVKDLFRDAQEQDDAILIHQMSVGQVYSITARCHSQQKAEAFLPLLEVLPLQVVASDLAVVLRAARLSAEYRMGAVTSLVVAAAEAEEAVLITADPEIKKVEECIPVQWLI